MKERPVQVLHPTRMVKALVLSHLNSSDTRVTVAYGQSKQHRNRHVDFTVETNLPPEITDLILTPEEPTSKDSLLLTATTRDPESADVTLQYQWFRNDEETEFASNQISIWRQNGVTTGM